MSTSSTYRLKNFKHVPQAHCSTTCVTDIARFDGVPLSEPMAFGLGEGLGFVFYQRKDISPASRFNGRARNLEENFYQRIGNPITWQKSWDPLVIKKSLEQDRPVIAKTSLAELPYYEPADFFGHGVLVIALDENTQQVEIAESFSAETQFISIEQFQRAIKPECLPLMHRYSYTAAPVVKFELNEVMIKDAIIATMSAFLTRGKPLEGVAAMDNAIAQIPTWQYLDDWQWHARFAYQSLEKRGTGGGNFRFMYADFLDEATTFIPKIAELKLADAFRESANEWQQLAEIFKTIFIDEKPSEFTAAAQQLKHIMQFEVKLCESILKDL